MRELKVYLKIFVILILIISVVLTIFRLAFYFIDSFPSSDNSFLYLMVRNRDLNFRTLYNLMDNGLIEYYQENPITGDKAKYLYFWYFIFYPMYLIPYGISVYIWDLLRLISTIYIILNVKKITENENDILIFLVFCSIGYFADMYLNNTNWLVQLLLFESYIQLKKENTLFSCIIFTLALYKIIILVFSFILIIVKKIKVKEILYYILPIAIICIPYIIFPNYFLQMGSNWFSNESNMTSSILLNLFLIIWPLIQMPHLLFISIIALILLANIQNEKLKKRLNILVYGSISLFWFLLWLFLLLIIAFFS